MTKMTGAVLSGMKSTMAARVKIEKYFSYMVRGALFIIMAQQKTLSKLDHTTTDDSHLIENTI